MNTLVILVLTICVMCAVESRSSKVKREASLNERLLQDAISQVHTRERRSATNRAYVLFDNRSERTARLMWRNINNPSKGWKVFTQLKPRAISMINTFESNEWKTEEVTTKKSLMIKDKAKYIPKANTKATRTVCIIKRPDQNETDLVIEKFVETLIVVDKSVGDMFNSNNSEVKRYVEVLLSLATRAYHHKTLTQHGLKIHLVPSRIIVRQNEIKFDRSKGDDNLYRACRVMNKLGNNDPIKYDHKLFLTRNEFGAGGYARITAMCGQSGSCSIVLDHGFSSTFTIAHEIAHSLGLSHGDHQQYSRYIMASMIDSLFNDHRWSTKSQGSLLTNTRKGYSCLDNKPSVVVKDYERPGEYFPFEKQCDLEYDETYTAWQPTKWQPRDPCAKLRCNLPGKWSHLHKTPGSPALDGTKCGELHEDKWCISGTCKDKSSNKSTT